VVRDQTQALLPGVTVTVTNLDTGVSRAVVSDDQGRYEAPNLPLGGYEVRGELSGFQGVTRRGIELTVGRHAVVDLVLSVGEFSENVVVSGEAALVESTTPTVAALVDEKTVLELPLNNRDLTQLTYLQAGVIRTRTTASAQGGFGTKITAGGARVDSNLYMVDGVVAGESSGSIQGVSGAYTGAETIREFQVITNNYSAEYRSTPGAIISAVTKSGTNEFLGSVFWFHRNDNLDAATFFDNAFGRERPEFKRNQYGFSVGGPIRRDRTFFFGSYEGLQERQATTGVARVPTLAARQGNLPGGVQVPVAPQVGPYLELWPAPNGRDYGDGTADYVAVDRLPTDSHFWTVKIDHFFPGDQLSGTYAQDVADNTRYGVLPDTNAFLWDSHRQVLSLRHQRVLTPNIFHELQFGYGRSTPRDDIPFPQRDLRGLEFRPVRPGIMGSISISQVTGIGHGRGQRDWSHRSYQLKESLLISRGRHSIRVGAEMHRFHNDVLSENQGYFGQYSFDSLRDFLEARPSMFVGQLELDPNVLWNLRQSVFGFFFQDDYKIRPSLTVNMGLRYEFATSLKDIQKETSNLRNFSDAEFTIGPLWKDNPTLQSFGPRLGFVWDPVGDGKTSVRGGFGIFYKHAGFYEYQTTLSALPPFVQIGDLRSNLIGPIRFPDAYQAQFALLATTPQARTVQWDPDQTSIYRWSLTIDRELPSQWVVSGGYTGSRGLHLWRQTDADIGHWVTLPDGRIFFPTPNTLLNPNFNQYRLTLTDGNSFYHGLTGRVSRRMSQGLQLQASYTFSKAVDEASDHTAGGAGFESQRTLYGFVNPRLNRSLAAFDVRQQFSLNFSYELPFGRDSGGITAALLQGWQLTTILLLADGAPLTITGGNITGQRRHIIGTSGLRPDLVPGGDNNPVLGGPERYFDPSQFVPSELGFLGNLGRNTLIGPGTATVDFSILKNLVVGGRQHFQFRVEVFNLLNRANFGNPSTNIFDTQGRPSATAGQITTTSTSARQIQLGLKFIF
jgi:hypothetical protein